MFSLAEWFGDAAHAVASKAYKWPRWARRVYVLTWPLSVIARVIITVTCIVLFLITAFVEFTIERLIHIWKGNRSMWD